MTMNTDCVVERLDIFKNQFICMSIIEKTGLTIKNFYRIISSHTNSSYMNSSNPNSLERRYERRKIWKKRKNWVLMSAAGRNGI